MDENPSPPSETLARPDPSPVRSPAPAIAGATPSEGSGGGCRKRKSMWDIGPNGVKTDPEFRFPHPRRVVKTDPEFRFPHPRRVGIRPTLQSSRRPEGARSPPPKTPASEGARAGERRAGKERLKEETAPLLIRSNPPLARPADDRPPKLQKKLYIPVKGHRPDDDLAGLIDGDTINRMQREMGATIAIHGSKRKALSRRDGMPGDLAESEEPYVLVEAKTQESLDAAAAMVEKQLALADQVADEHRSRRQQQQQQQQREPKKLDRAPDHPGGTAPYGSLVYCEVCGYKGHSGVNCAMRWAQPVPWGPPLPPPYGSYPPPAQIAPTAVYPQDPYYGYFAYHSTILPVPPPPPNIVPSLQIAGAPQSSEVATEQSSDSCEDAESKNPQQ